MTELVLGTPVTVIKPYSGLHGKRGTIAVLPKHTLSWYGVRLEQPTEYMETDTISLRENEFEVDK